METKAVIYTRVSSVGNRQSNDRQIEDLKILANQKSYKIEKIYEEHISGAKKNTERPILSECLEYCFSENVKILLISELSRLGRNVDEVLKNVMLCKERKLNVYFQKENLSIFDDQGREHPFLTIFIAVLGTVSQMERENIKFRLNSGRELYKRNGGKLGRKVGYRKPEETKREQYQEVIRLLKKGYTIRSIAKLENIGISTVMRIKNEFINKTEES